MPAIPDRPTAAEVRAAVELILIPIEEFPFVSDDDQATWIGLAFTPALRPMLPGPYQMGVITATNPGSGKTLLTKMLTILHGGVRRGEMPRDSDELRKSITAALMDTTAPIITFDNLTGVVRSSVLESLLTSRTWTDRWLGQNKSVTATNDRLWLATGNNAQFGGDLARRIAPVALDPPEADHHLRTDFKIKDLDGWMQSNGRAARRDPDSRSRMGERRPPRQRCPLRRLRGMGQRPQRAHGLGTVPRHIRRQQHRCGRVLRRRRVARLPSSAVHGVFGSIPFTTKDLVDTIGTGRRTSAALTLLYYLET